MKNLLDPYMDVERFYSRIRDEYRKYGKLIIAFDFDDTVFDTHHNDWQYEAVIQLLNRWTGRAYFICWSASPKERFPMMQEYFDRNGIPCDAINQNAPWLSPDMRHRKIYANVYLDDRCGITVAYWALNRLINEIEEGKVCLMQ